MTQETRTRKVPYTTCRQVCETRMTTKTHCVPRQICETKVRCVPRTVCRQVPVETCCPVDPSCAAPAATACGSAPGGCIQ